MVYIFESELLENKSILIALTQIFGIGNSNSSLICKNLGFAKNLKVKALSKEQLNLLIKTVENLDFSLASDLKKEKLLTFKKLISIKSYRGLRKYQGLPVRGQRTHTNAKTAKKRKKS
nr:ribosomal protein S13 [Gomphonema parvulum]